MTEHKFPIGTKVRIVFKGSLFNDAIGTVVEHLPLPHMNMRTRVSIEAFSPDTEHKTLVKQIMTRPVEKRLYYFTDAELEVRND